MTADSVSLPVSSSVDRQLAHVTLVRPTLVASGGAWVSSLTPPLGLAYLAAVLRENGNPVAIIDAIAEKPDQIIEESGYLFHGLTIDETVAQIDPDTDIIGISCMFTQDWPWVRQLIRAVRDRLPDKLIVAGGEHAHQAPPQGSRAGGHQRGGPGEAQPRVHALPAGEEHPGAGAADAGEPEPRRGLSGRGGW